MAIVEQKWSALAGALRDGAPRPGAQGALLRPGLLRRWRPSSCGRGSGRWRAGSRRSRSRTTSSSTRSSTSRSSCCAPTTWACARSRTRAAIAASRSSRAAGPARAGSPARSTAGATALDGKNTARPAAAGRSPSTTCEPDDIDLTPVRCEMWGGCAWINLDDDAPPLRQCIEPVRHDPRRVEGGVAADRVVVRVPPPGELEARRRGVRGAVPRGARRTRSSSSPARYRATRRRRRSTRGRSSTPSIHYLRTMSDGMAGMVHANDVRIAEGLRDIELPADPTLAMADLEPHAQRRGRALAPRRGPRHPRPQRARRAGDQRADGPLLPALLRAADVQQRVRRTASARSDRRRR